MKVTISVGGKFHAFLLAQELQKKGVLERIFTTYPGFRLKGYEISDGKAKSLALPELIYRLGQASFSRSFLLWSDYQKADLFDRMVEARMNRSDIFHVFAGFGLRSIAKAKKLGAVTFLDRASTHVDFQEEILREEYSRWGIPFVQKPRRMRDRELKEYEVANYILVPSEFARESFKQKGIPDSKLVKVPFGMDHERFRKVPKRDDVFRVLFVGSLSVRKGLGYLLEAFKELKLPNSELCLVGGIAPETKALLRKFSGVFRYVGHIPHDRLFEWYSQSSVLVLPSVEEGLAYVIGEAMACGLPVIATNHTGAEEAIRDGIDGFVIPVRDTHALKEKLLWLYENPRERDQMAWNALSRSSRFSWGRYTQEVLEKYRGALETRLLRTIQC